MNNSAQNKNHSLMEAYYAVYDENIRNELNEEKQIKEFLEVIDFLIEDGYDLSEYTYEELYEFHITERLGGLLKGALKGAAGAVYKGAKEPAKKVLTKLGQLAVPTAVAAGLDQYYAGGWFRNRIGDAHRGLRQMGHSLPTPGQAADAFKAPETTTKTTPPRRNLPPAHLTQSYSYRKNNIITEDPAFPSQKPKGGDWSKLTIGGITKIWDPENNSYQLPGTINKRLKSQGEKEITVPGKAPAPTPSPAPTPAPAPTPSPAPTPAPAPTPSPAPTPAPKPTPTPSPAPTPSPSRSSSSATASTADKIKGGMDVYNKQRSSGDFKGASETGKSVWALSNPKLSAAAAERARTRGTSQSDNPLMKGMPGKRPMTPSVQSPTLATDLGKGSGNQSIVDNPNASKSATPKPTPTPTPARNGFGVSAAPIAARASVANVTAPKVKATTIGGPKTRAQVMSNSYEYDAYDLVLEYLFSQGHVETVEEANYVMLVMDAETIGSIVEEYENDLLAEEITEWVNELVEGGYDLSEYTWDDLAEYYVNEGFKETGYHDDEDPYSSGFGRRNQSITTSSRGRRIQNRVRSLEKSGDKEKADHIHKSASSINKAERGLAKSRRNKSRGPGPKRARQDAMRDMKDSDFS
jgi:hypothetical protein